ncbi:hypothetical protein PR202_gb19499 [Eleusine coracana subsp. coracana]|uniref:Rhodanese domain-containing protein n=1 Tax=Eleusine coracana subsp. coracana TaxID=191504 RepID=A0AAV5F641_ELECO|nr:hypothetical protein PR202_gb19499 [Eleusine coracana subsp. coracana]
MDKNELRRRGLGNAEELVRSGTVRPVRPRDARDLLGVEGFRLLDVRPEWRARARRGAWLGARAAVRGDDDMGLVTLLKKWVHFGYIGLWTGQSFTKMNDRFLDDVAAAVAGDGKDAQAPRRLRRRPQVTFRIG